MECSDTSFSTSTLHASNLRQEYDGTGMNSAAGAPSQPQSPRSSSHLSPTDSPPDSISSLPSIGSSFFFSSAAASPPHSHTHTDHARDTAQGLIIPSLMLPAALPHPTPYGKMLGSIQLLIVGDGAEDRDFVSHLLLDDNEDVVDPGVWEDTDDGSILRASTDWLKHRDPHSLENFAPARNVNIVTRHNASSILPIIHSPFHLLLEIIHPHCQPSVALADLIASPWTPIYTALIILTKSTPSVDEDAMADTFASHIPVIVFQHGLDPARLPPRPHMSSFCPPSASALRHGLFRSPDTLSSLRYEAAERFLRWREVERAVESIHAGHRETIRHISEKLFTWDKAKWEAEWEPFLSHDVATRSREDTITNSSPDTVCRAVPCSVDPLHFSSLITFSFSLLAPAKTYIRYKISRFVHRVLDDPFRVAMVGSFCIGVGVGWMLSWCSGH